jgi:hypothetical protein
VGRLVAFDESDGEIAAFFRRRWLRCCVRAIGFMAFSSDLVIVGEYSKSVLPS